MTELLKVCFAIDPEYSESCRAEIEETFRDPYAQNVIFDNRKVSELQKEKIEEPVLYLADSAKTLGILQAAGCACAGYLHAGNEKEDLSAASFLISEPDCVDRDSYEKIYERLTGRPWTILETERCVVREFVPEDAGAILGLYQDEGAARFLTVPPQDEAREKKVISSYIKTMYALYGYGNWAVLSKADGSIIGRAGFEPYKAGEELVSFGYLFRADVRRMGYAAEVCAALVRYGRNMLGFPGIEALTDADNAASVALLGKLGFEREGTGFDEGRQLLRFVKRFGQDR